MADFADRRTMMVDTQVRPSDVTRFPIIAAMLAVPREAFVAPALREAAYVGENLALGPNRVMLEPRTIAKMLDGLDPKPGERALVIAGGRGYAAALLAHMGLDVLVREPDARLAAEAAGALAAAGARGVAVECEVEIEMPETGTFDVVLVEGGVEVIPDAWLAELREGGRIALIHMQGSLGTVRFGYRDGGVLTWRSGFHAGAPVMPGFTKAVSFVL